jgi:hemerythrin-like domain-containing protein
MENWIRSLSHVHNRLADLFQDHQVALMDRDLERAGELLERFGKALKAHIRHEEDVLLPVYRERVSFGRLGNPEHLLDEHRQIQESLQRLEEEVKGLRAGDAGLARALIRVVEQEWRFKQLLEHHNEREDRTLYPCLDETTSPEERSELLRAGLKSEDA